MQARVRTFVQQELLQVVAVLDDIRKRHARQKWRHAFSTHHAYSVQWTRISLLHDTFDTCQVACLIRSNTEANTSIRIQRTCNKSRPHRRQGQRYSSSIWHLSRQVSSTVCCAVNQDLLRSSSLTAVSDCARLSQLSWNLCWAISSKTATSPLSNADSPFALKSDLLMSSIRAVFVLFCAVIEARRALKHSSTRTASEDLSLRCLLWPSWPCGSVVDRVQRQWR